PTGKVHEGFRDALDVVWPDLEARLAKISPGRQVWFSGHSLGAALATLAADRYVNTRGVCTFGSPRVGDPAFAKAFDTRLAGRSLRFVNDNDVVPHVPPPLPTPYRHVETTRCIAPDGRVSGAPPSIEHFFADLIGDTRHLLEVMVGLNQNT